VGRTSLFVRPSKTNQGRALLTIIGAISELERSLIVERVKAGMRRAKLEGRRIGRAPLNIDREQVVNDRRSGMSLTKVASKHHISRASVGRLMREAGADATRVIAEVQQASMQLENAA